MDNELKHLKSDLNRTVYRGQHFTEKNKMEIRDRIYRTKDASHVSRFKSALSVIVCFALLMALGSFAWHEMTAPETATPSSHGETDTLTNAVIKNVKPFNVLYVQQQTETKKLKSVIVMTINPGEKSVTLLNLPPTLQMGSGKPGDKATKDLQQLYSEAPNRFDKVVSNLLNIPIKNKLMMTDDSFMALVKAIGGVEVYNTFEYEYQGFKISKGNLQLDGGDALVYFDMVNNIYGGEPGRMERQQAVIKSILKRVSIQKIFSNIKEYQKSKDIIPFVQKVIDDHPANDFRIQAINLKVSPRLLGDTNYYVAAPEAIKTVTEKLQQQLK